MTKLSIIGLGKLGACSAVCFASKGFEVVGVDINNEFVDSINKGKAPVFEPRLQELLISSKGKLRATHDYREAISDTQITFLIVPSPSRQDGHFSTRYLEEALRHLAVALKKFNKKYHLFVITSTVSPGDTEGSLISLIEQISGKKLNKDFGVCYNPEFIALGSVINDFLKPDMVLIGESNKLAGDMLQEVYTVACENKPYFARMSIISAEITKISLNSYITMKISFANTLSNICEKIPGADIDAITKALGADKRVSPYYLRGGLAYGGPCFPRDNTAFAALANKHGINAHLARTTDNVNKLQIEHTVECILSHIPANKNNIVAILGLAYKPNTPVIEESAGIKIIEELLTKKDIEVIAYDSLAMDNAKAHFGDSILYASSVKDCFLNATICIITTQDEEFKLIDHKYIIHKPTIIIDCWRMLNPKKLGDNVKYVALGRSIQ